MKLRVSFDGEDDSLTAGLYRWLARDANLVAQGKISLEQSPVAPDRQGGLFEAVNILIANATALASFVTAVLTYRVSRRGHDAVASIRIERDGVVVTLEPGSPWSAEEVIAQLSGTNDVGSDSGQP